MPKEIENFLLDVPGFKPDCSFYNVLPKSVKSEDEGALRAIISKEVNPWANKGGGTAKKLPVREHKEEDSSFVPGSYRANVEKYKKALNTLVEEGSIQRKVDDDELIAALALSSIGSSEGSLGVLGDVVESKSMVDKPVERTPSLVEVEFRDDTYSERDQELIRRRVLSSEQSRFTTRDLGMTQKQISQRVTELMENYGVSDKEEFKRLLKEDGLVVVQNEAA